MERAEMLERMEKDVNYEKGWCSWKQRKRTKTV